MSSVVTYAMTGSRPGRVRFSVEEDGGRGPPIDGAAGRVPEVHAGRRAARKDRAPAPEGRKAPPAWGAVWRQRPIGVPRPARPVSG